MLASPTGRAVAANVQPVQLRVFNEHLSFEVTTSTCKALQLCFDDVESTVDLVAAFVDPAVSELIYVAGRPRSVG